MMTARLMFTLSGFIGTLYLAQLGHQVLAASALITATQIFLFVTLISIFYAVGALVSRAIGAGKPREAGAIVRQGFILAVLLWTIPALISPNLQTLLNALGQSHQLTPIVQSYFNLYVFSMLPNFLVMPIIQFLMSVGEQKTIVKLGSLSLTINTLLGAGLVFGKVGLPQLGVRGLALTYICQSTFSLCLYLFIISRERFTKYGIFQRRNFVKLEHLKSILHVGTPIALQTGSDLLSYMVLILLVGWLGHNELASQQIVAQYTFLLVVPILAMAQSSTVLVGKAIGAKNYIAMQPYGYACLTITCGFMLLVSLIFITCPKLLIGFYVDKAFLKDQAFMQMTSFVLFLTGLRLLFDASMESLTGSLRAMLDTKFCLLIQVLTVWFIGTPLLYLFGFVLKGGLVGITLAGVVMNLVATILLYIRWSKLLRRFQLAV